MHLESLENCKLSIGSYPEFTYNAKGGGGKFRTIQTKQRTIKKIEFDSKTFKIPSLNTKTTKILGFSLPPGIEIKVVPILLQGNLNSLNGELSLEFESKFCLSIWPGLSAPPLIVKTCLNNTQDGNRDQFIKDKFKKMNFQTCLQGNAIISKTGNFFLDIFLGLPTQAIAILKCRIIEE